MNAFREDLRELVSKHIALAPSPRILGLVEQLAGYDRPLADRFEFTPAPRFTTIGADGTPLLDAQDGDHVATYDSRTNLTWLASPLSCGEVPWAQAIKEANKVRVFGATDWRLPTIKELLSIVDYDRYDPAVDPAFFKGPYGWTWSSTPAKSPSGYAWFVGLNGGGSVRGRQASHGRVRAVRAGQPLALGL